MGQGQEQVSVGQAGELQVAEGSASGRSGSEERHAVPWETKEIQLVQTSPRPRMNYSPSVPSLTS